MNTGVAILLAGVDETLSYLSYHVLGCLVPAFFIAGGIAALLSKEAIIRYFGASAKRWLSYSIASVSGTILAVRSCTVLPDVRRSLQNVAKKALRDELGEAGGGRWSVSFYT